MKNLKFRDAVCKRRLRDELRHILVARDDADEKTKVRELAEWLDVGPEDIEVQSDVDFYVDGEHYIVADYDKAYELATKRVRDFIDTEGLTNFSESFKGEVLNYCLNKDELRDIVREDIEYQVVDEYDVDDSVEEYEGEWDEKYSNLSILQKIHIIHDYLDSTFLEDPQEMLKSLKQNAIDNDIDPSIYDGLSDEEILEEYNDDFGYSLDTLEDFNEDEKISVATDYFGFNEQDEIDNLVDEEMKKWKRDPIEFFEDIYGDTDEVLKFVTDHNLVDLDEVAKRVIGWDGIGQQLASYDGYENSLGSNLYGYHDSKRRRHMKRNRDSIRHRITRRRK